MSNEELKKELNALSKKSSVEELQKYIKDMIETRGLKNKEKINFERIWK